MVVAGEEAEHAEPVVERHEDHGRAAGPRGGHELRSLVQVLVPRQRSLGPATQSGDERTAVDEHHDRQGPAAGGGDLGSPHVQVQAVLVHVVARAVLGRALGTPGPVGGRRDLGVRRGPGIGPAVLVRRGRPRRGIRVRDAQVYVDGGAALVRGECSADRLPSGRAGLIRQRDVGAGRAGVRPRVHALRSLGRRLAADHGFVRRPAAASGEERGVQEGYCEEPLAVGDRHGKASCRSVVNREGITVR